MIDPKHKKRFWGLTSILAIVMMAGVLMAANTNNQRGVANLDYTFLGQYPTSGNYYFVDNQSSYAQDSCIRNGGTWDQPLNTIDFAIGCTTAGNGDIIFVAAGHAANVSSGPFINVDVASTKIIGIGAGRNRPTLTWTNKDGMIAIVAVNVSLENFILDMSFATGSDTGVSVTAADFTFKNNEVILSDDSTGKVGHALYLSGATRAQIIDSRFVSPSLAGAVGTSGVTEVIFIGSGVDDVNLDGVYIQAYSNTLLTGLIQAASSRVSGFTLSNSTLIQGNSGSSTYNFSVVGLVSDMIVENVVSIIGNLATSGLTSQTLTDLDRGPQFDAQL